MSRERIYGMKDRNDIGYCTRNMTAVRSPQRTTEQPKDEAVGQNETPEPADHMTEAERQLLLQYVGGHEMYAKVNGRRFTVLYSSRHNGDPMPWIYKADPSLRFVNEVVSAKVTKCKVCGDNVGSGYKYRAAFPAMDLCERDAVRELAGDLVQIEKGNLK